MRATIAGGRWPDEGRQRSEGQTLLEVWARHWQARPDLAVLVDGWHAERVLEAAALDRRTAQMATVLAHNGLRPGDRVIWHGRARVGTDSVTIDQLFSAGEKIPGGDKNFVPGGVGILF